MVHLSPVLWPLAAAFVALLRPNHNHCRHVMVQYHLGIMEKLLFKLQSQANNKAAMDKLIQDYDIAAARQPLQLPRAPSVTGSWSVW